MVNVNPTASLFIVQYCKLAGVIEWEREVRVILTDYIGVIAYIVSFLFKGKFMSIEWRWLYNEAEERELQEAEQNRENLEIQNCKNLAERSGVSW